MTDGPLEVNRAYWDERGPVHAAAPGYGVERFVADPTHLSEVVRFDLPLLGDVRGLRGVHLQCHIGTDTVSLARLGARMTGLDFSAASLDQARDLAARAGADVDFVHSEVYRAADVLPPGSFDLVYTGIGALCWLPSIDRWAQVVARLLRPGGRLFIREGHPVLWALDDKDPARLELRYPYFETEEPVTFDEPGTYVATDEELHLTVAHSWNHGIGEILTAVLDAGMDVTGFVEHTSVPWNPMAEGAFALGDDGEWRLVDRPDRLPASYTLQAVRR
jgi:SAM-dependent methyltransferase